MSASNPARYDGWYRTERGRWIGETEFRLTMRMLSATPGESVLDVGTGTGYFTRRFAEAGLAAIGLDRDPAMIGYARERAPDIPYLIADATAIPAQDASFDYVVAITSLCFIDDPARAVAETWRVARRAVLLGLLNRHSLLFLQKRGRGDYRGARWDSLREVREWTRGLAPAPAIRARSAIHLPSGSRASRWVERTAPRFPLSGGFLAVCLQKRVH